MKEKKKKIERKRCGYSISKKIRSIDLHEQRIRNRFYFRKFD